MSDLLIRAWQGPLGLSKWLCHCGTGGHCLRMKTAMRRAREHARAHVDDAPLATSASPNGANFTMSAAKLRVHSPFEATFAWDAAARVWVEEPDDAPARQDAYKWEPVRVKIVEDDETGYVG